MIHTEKEVPNDVIHNDVVKQPKKSNSRWIPISPSPSTNESRDQGMQSKCQRAQPPRMWNLSRIETPSITRITEVKLRSEVGVHRAQQRTKEAQSGDASARCPKSSGWLGSGATEDTPSRASARPFAEVSARSNVWLKAYKCKRT